jgi:hypothetical protein
LDTDYVKQSLAAAGFILIKSDDYVIFLNKKFTPPTRVGVNCNFLFTLKEEPGRIGTEVERKEGARRKEGKG